MPTFPCFKRVRTILHLLKEILVEKSQAAEKVEEALQQTNKVPPSLEASSLKEHEVRDLLGLSQDDRAREIWSLNEEDIIPVPTIVRDRLRDIREVLGGDPTNEATCRWILDVILQTCIPMEQQEKKDRCVTLTAESHLELRVKYNGDDRILSGKSDYSIWYDNKGMSTNTVICEAKDEAGVSGGVPQCLAYMGMVHHIRKQEGRINAVVYGCVSDGDDFTFLRIDNEARSASALSSPIYSAKKIKRTVDNASTGRQYWRLRIGSSNEDKIMSG
ncbi:hypothetical protein DTO195F2_7863 [Paecilomyces variotii]|nr:hypothetical protein DTO195F2_7863 [Paecilomyces variotii]